MNLGIQGRVALVAAASQGLGKASAAALAAEGVKVAILSRREDAVQSAAKEIGAALALRCDLSRAEDIASTVERIRAELGPISILVNNCGGPPAGRFDTISEEQWYSSFEQVFLSALRLTRAVIPDMKQAQWGRIINVVSISVEQPIAGLIISNAFRPALAGWAKTLAGELAPHNILVNSVSPGRILTARTNELDRAMAEQSGQPIEKIRADRSVTIPLKRYGMPEEFGSVVAFLASERAAYLTGSVLRVDGGAVSAI
ncbi:MAG: SDR family oxidoreductase [Bryobacterales bacterium]|nr:SDR family oxidoreductase [Bryobacterales bacterium]